MSATSLAVYAGQCSACAQPVEKGSAIVRHTGTGFWVHVGCEGRFTNMARCQEALKLHPKRARKIAMVLGLTVTVRGKYLEHPTICFAAGAAPANDSKWLAAVALATGKQVSENGEITITLSGGSAGESKSGGGSMGQASAATQQAASQAGQKLNQDLIRDEVAAATKAQTASVLAACEASLKTALANLDAKIEAAAAKQPPKEIVVKVGDKDAVKLDGLMHFKFPVLLKMVAAAVNVWIAGPAGSGKTTGAETVAKTLGLPFFFNGAIDTEYKLSGFVDAHGKIVSTSFRRAYTEGGVYLFDEVDASLPGALLAFNAAMANGHCDFPGDPNPVVRHPDFRCIAAGNTWGMGATTEYVGRNKMDAAFLDRFVQLDWPYDEALESSLATDSAWCKTVQKLRAKAKQRGMKVVISPRATINGCKLLSAGFSTEEVLDATVFAKLSQTDRDNLRNS